jgi:integrase
MPEFWRAIGEIRNPVRADLVRVLILTGLRSLDARTIEWADIAGLDGDEPTLHRPNPKGGPKKAFTVPISSAVAEVFRRRRAENETLFPGCPLVFPTTDHTGRGVTHIKNAEEDSLRGFGYTPHRARDTFATACEESGVSVLATKVLLNHRDKTITEGYQRLSLGHLREAAEKVARFLLGKAGVKAEAA